MPTLPEILALIGGPGAAADRGEIAGPRRSAGSARAVASALEGYRGPVAVMSFNPEVGALVRAARSRSVLRGLVVTEKGEAACAAG